jgi:hypothetical protein
MGVVDVGAFLPRSFLATLRDLCPELARSAPGALRSAKQPAQHLRSKGKDKEFAGAARAARRP